MAGGGGGGGAKFDTPEDVGLEDDIRDGGGGGGAASTEKDIRMFILINIQLSYFFLYAY